MAKRKGLGRGLDALLGASQTQSARETSKSQEQGLRTIPLDLLSRGKFQPRMHFEAEALDELTQSIKAQGVVQPIIVRQLPGQPNRYEIIAGERRWRAAQAAGLGEIPAVVREVDDEQALAMSLIENIQREDLNPIEEARALHRLIDEFVMTHELAAEAVGRSRASVSNLLRLLELNDDVRQLVETGELSMGHARALLALSGVSQSQAARDVVGKSMSARETEELVRRLKEGARTDDKPSRRSDPDVQRLEEDLSQRLGAPVQIKHNTGGKGIVSIRYTSLEELDGIIEHIK